MDILSNTRNNYLRKKVML